MQAAPSICPKLMDMHAAFWRWHVPKSRSAHTKFSTCIHTKFSTSTCYYWVEKNRTGDNSAPLARRDHRKSKFGLRHAIKLLELYCMTKSEFWFSIAWPRTSGRNVPQGRVNCQTRARRAGGMRQFFIAQLDSTKFSSRSKFSTKFGSLQECLQAADIILFSQPHLLIYLFSCLLRRLWFINPHRSYLTKYTLLYLETRYLPKFESTAQFPCMLMLAGTSLHGPIVTWYDLRHFFLSRSRVLRFTIGKY